MTTSGQRPTPRPAGGDPCRHGREAGRRRHRAGSPWGLAEAGPHRDDGIATRSRRDQATPTGAGARSRRDDASTDFVLRAIQRAFQ